MTHEEKRLYRRELINECIHRRFTLELTRAYVRMAEFLYYGDELRAYDK